ncbi:methyltransferase domain-containing protein [Xylanibacillus composti]|uniref:HTH merR-type domain-containing protein n=1 Tax=Xylanibacillus composti TaxID=1572762 RepID=A0A8J4M0G9_9BACL|nr:MerR family transcriptional regulator [Xylanibacillus composti]MDT9723935.1 methyltransferase domain-containing protein [Xylanibacillus composti]GIQ67815.1 hypothetical protein XYCOK13_06390 [Xylanibacillus composti]
MKISDVAEQLKITPRTIRFYESKGLIAPAKEGNGYRRFSEQEVWRLQTILALREALDDVENRHPKELLGYLELQRAVMVRQWLEYKQMIETTDRMIHMLLQADKLPIEDIYQLAQSSRRLREERASWRDQWNYDERAKFHDEQVAGGSAAKYRDYERALDLAVQWLAPIAGERGLDIGTGTGNAAGKLLAKGAQMAGVDQSREMLKEARRKFPALETRLGNFLALPYLEAEFDLVVTCFAFRHLNEEQQLLALEEMRRVLKPRGRICLVDLMVREEVSSASPADASAYPSASRLLRWFEQHDYATKHEQMNEQLHLVYALPIRA